MKTGWHLCDANCASIDSRSSAVSGVAIPGQPTHVIESSSITPSIALTSPPDAITNW